jgi:hypothetical protein
LPRTGGAGFGLCGIVFSSRVGFAGRVTPRQRIKVRGYVRLTISYQPTDAHEWDASSENTILLQRTSGAAGNFFYIAVTEQRIEHGLPLATRVG